MIDNCKNYIGYMIIFEQCEQPASSQILMGKLEHILEFLIASLRSDPISSKVVLVGSKQNLNGL